MKARSLIISALLLLSLVGVGFDSQPALKNQADEIDRAIKAITKRITDGAHPSFQQSDIQQTLVKFQKLSVDLSTASIHADATRSASEIAIITSVGTQYLSELYSFYVLYAQAAHASGAAGPSLNFDALASYSLKLKQSTALDLLKLKPFNTRHLSDDVIEFYTNSQDKQMAEFLSLAAPKDETSYARLIQFSALHETFTNLWAIQRLTGTEISTQPVLSCAPSLLSFHVPPSGQLKESEAYLELESADRYKGLSTLMDGAFEKTLKLPFLTQENYYEILSKTLSGTNEFKNYTSGLPPKNVSDWLNKAAQLVAKVEQDDWVGNSQTSEKILAASTLMNDRLSTAEIAIRMANTVFNRREMAAITEISTISANNVKVADLASIQKKAKDLIDSTYRAQWVAESQQQLAASIANLDRSSLKIQEAAARAKDKVADTLTLASYLMPAMHDYDLITKTFGKLVEKAEDVPRIQKNLHYVYLRPEFKLAVSDAETFKTYLLKEIQNNGLWSRLQNNSQAMLLLNSFFVQLADDYKTKAEAEKISNFDQASRLLLAIAQADANALIQKSAPITKKVGLLKLVAQNLDLSSFYLDENVIKSVAGLAGALSAQSEAEAPQKLLQSAFATINLLGAKNPTDISPLTSQQEDLAEIVINQGYALNPLLAVRTNGDTVLERIYREALAPNPHKQLDYAIGSQIVLDGIQTAAHDIQGKLEDFCQADIGNPSRDLRFRRLFKSAQHLRQTIIHSQNSDELKKFDESLDKKSQTTTEKVLNKVINPLFMVLTAAMVLVLIISLFNPLTTIPALGTLMVIANFGMIGLSVVSSYFEISNQFIEQPAQIKYQEALASAQVSADEHSDQWAALKANGFISSVNDRVTSDQAKQALITSQVLAVPQVAMNAWVGYGGLKQVASNMGLTGMMKYKELAGAEMPGWAEKTAPPEAKTFAQNLKEQGAGQAFKQKASQVMDVIKNAAGVTPTFGTYTSEEALSALKTALERVLPEQSKELLPEVELYRDFLKGRLKVSSEVSNLSYAEDGAEIHPPSKIPDEQYPEFIKANSNLHVYEDTGVRTADGAGEILKDTGKPMDNVRRYWTETPEMLGNLSWKEMLENPQLLKSQLLSKNALKAASASWKELLEDPTFLKWRLIPKSALKAARAGSAAFDLWVKQYGSVVKLIDMLRGELIAGKLAAFETLTAKLELLSSQGLSTAEVLRSLDPQEMALLQETARGPRFLAYGYWDAKSAEQEMSSLPLRHSVDVFDTYNKMIESLKPNDWTPAADTAKAASPDQADVRNFYRIAKSMDGDYSNSKNPKVLQLEAGIERTLFRHAN